MRPTLIPISSASPRENVTCRPQVRVRISNLLDAAHNYAVSLLVAGAGYGKSTALAQWLNTRPEAILFGVREDCIGIFDFARGLAAALGLNSKSAAAAVNAAYKSQHPEFDLCAWFDNQLRKFGETIAIDDFHIAAATDARVSKLMAKLIDRTSPRIKWVISSRQNCDLPIASWIAYGKALRPISESDLAFDVHEAREIARNAGLALTAGQLEALHFFTSGWPIGMTLALVNAHSALDIDNWTTATREMSYEYLAQQVFDGLREDDRDFLLTSCVYESIDAQILERAGFANPHERLDYLKEYGTFIQREPSGAFRYHTLLRDFLRDRLARDATRNAAVWRKAAAVYDDLSTHPQALAAYQHAGNPGAVASFLECHGFDLIERGHRSAVMRALAWLIKHRARLDAPILALQANCEANGGDHQRAEFLYRSAIERSCGDEQRATLTLQFARELVQRNRLDGIALLEPLLLLQISPKLHAQILGVLATYYSVACRHREALRAIQEALALNAGFEDPALHAILMHQSTFVHAGAGDDSAVLVQAQKALELATNLELHALCARIQSILYTYASLRDDFPQALWWNRQMEKAALESGESLLLFTALAGAYEIEVERANDEAITKFDERLAAFDRERYVRATQVLYPALALRAAWEARFDKALRLLRGTAVQQISGPRRALRAAEVALYAAAVGHRGEAEEMIGYCQQQLKVNDSFEPHSLKRYAKTMTFAALANLLLGRAASASRCIAEIERQSNSLSVRYRALSRALRSMYVHSETRVLEAETEASLTELQNVGFAGMARLLRALPLPIASRDSSRHALLTHAEVEVLRMLQRHGTTKAVAAVLGKSPHTIDWHVKSVMRKLGVSRRQEALSYAREAGITG